MCTDAFSLEHCHILINLTCYSFTVVCFDAKINFDDNAEFRQKEIFAMDNTSEGDPIETEAAKYDLKYIGLDGNIACFGNYSETYCSNV